MTTPDKPKGNDRAEKTKSQFYVDLTEGNTLRRPCPSSNGGLVISNQSDFRSGRPETSPVSPGVHQAAPATRGASSVFSSVECETEKEENKPSSTKEHQQCHIVRPKRPPPPPPPSAAFARGSVGRTSKSHTQLGVLVIPDSLCQSQVYRQRASSTQERPPPETMGADYSRDSVEDEDDESSSSSRGSVSEMPGHNVQSGVQQQYNSVVSQLCDYIYTTPILPSTHHYCYANNRPPIQPKPKNIPPPKIRSVRTTEKVIVSIAKNRNKVSEQSPVKTNGSHNSQVMVSEDSDRTGDDCSAPPREIAASGPLRDDFSERMTCKHEETSNMHDLSSQESDANYSTCSDGTSEQPEEPEQTCRTVIANRLGADASVCKATRDDVDFVPLNQTNSECDVQSQTLTCEPLISDPFVSSATTISITSTTDSSSMSVADSSDTTNTIEAPSQSPGLTPRASPILSSNEKRDQKIFFIAKELMTSERVFVDVLRLLNVDFRNFVYENMAEHLNRISPAANNNNYKVNKNVMQEEDLNKILNYLPQLQNLNEVILKDLEGRITDWERQKKISDVIVKTGPFLKLYSAYIKEFQSQCDHLEECCQRFPHFTRVVKEFEASDRCAKLSIKHFMLKPVQRIPQYRLLLEDYLKHLPDDSQDYVDTQTALAVVSNVASHANETMKQGTNFMKLLALQDRLTCSQNSNDMNNANSNASVTNAASTSNTHYELVRPGRSLLKEGELLKLCRRGMQPRYYILLSDVLLYTSFITSGPGGALRVNYELPLEGMRVETPKAEDFKNEFSVISTSRSFTLQAKSAEERDEWIQALRDAIEDNASRRSTFLRAKIPTFQHPNTSSLGKQAPVWIPDNRVTMCQQCTAEFTLTFRRHHCRACGKVVCDHCSANRAPLQYKKNQSLRVCDTCFEVLQAEFERRFEGTITNKDPQESELRRASSLKGLFKRGVRENRSHTRKRVPERLLEVSASDAASQMCGYLRVMVRRSLRRGWFVLKDRVLYEYRAPQDVCALQSLPVLGYQVETMDKASDVSDGLDNCLTFKLTHPNRPPIVFHTDSPHLAEKWIQAMREAVVLE
ncbi:FYVE, RhoGEF and PH domain-containing protein 6-like [Macrobrachium nipponense]|uniref:FYVE, RhoGEF and PH domain-containing protein 6-like n=1 Tax=Macrobrachium nipponense TaxID=159736 RepID=UPI0030C8A5C8